MRVAIEQERLWNELQALAEFNDAELPAVTRVLFTPADLKAREYLLALCGEAGLSVRTDPIGNMFARWEGSEPALPAVATGSHYDAIPQAGRFDGTVGILGALEAIRALKRMSFQPKRSIELIIFTAEEPTRFGLGCLGSRALCGAMAPEALRNLRDSQGQGLEEVRLEVGMVGDLAEVKLPKGHYSSFVELHIEQGPILERDLVPIGLVTAIAAPASMRVFLEGEGGHAGAVLMPERHDALCAAAEVVLAVETAAKSSGSINTVGTVGVCEVSPGAVNSVPSKVRLEIDIRDVDLMRRDGVVEQVTRAVDGVCARREIRYRLEMLNADPPARAAPEVLAALVSACQELGVLFKPMVSRAYHDALFMSRIAPTSMVFIPCQGGVSHRPDEYAEPEDIARGVQVLASALARLSLV
jgi:N-carbamoyl-L-amino-acid hydrolase